MKLALPPDNVELRALVARNFTVPVGVPWVPLTVTVMVVPEVVALQPAE